MYKACSQLPRNFQGTSLQVELRNIDGFLMCRIPSVCTRAKIPRRLHVRRVWPLCNFPLGIVSSEFPPPEVKKSAKLWEHCARLTRGKLGIYLSSLQTWMWHKTDFYSGAFRARTLGKIHWFGWLSIFPIEILFVTKPSFELLSARRQRVRHVFRALRENC